MQKKNLCWLLCVIGLFALCFFPSCASKKSDDNTNNGSNNVTPPVPSEYGQREVKLVYEEYQSPQSKASLKQEQLTNSALPMRKRFHRMGWGAKRDRNIRQDTGPWNKKFVKNAEESFLKPSNTPISGYTRNYEYNPSDHVFYRRYNQTNLNGSWVNCECTLNGRSFPTYAVYTYSDGKRITHELTISEKFYKYNKWIGYYEDTDTPRFKRYEETRTRDGDGWCELYTEKEFRKNGSMVHDLLARVYIKGPYFYYCPEHYYEYYENGQLSNELHHTFDTTNNNIPVSGSYKEYEENGDLRGEWSLTYRVEYNTDGKLSRIICKWDGTFWFEYEFQYNDRDLISNFMEENADDSLNYSRAYYYYTNPVNSSDWFMGFGYSTVYNNGDTEEDKIEEWTETRRLRHFYRNGQLVELRDFTLAKVGLPN